MSRSPFPPLGRSRRRHRQSRRALAQAARAVALVLALAAIVAATTWPWSTWVGHPHWGSVRLLPWTILTKPWEPLANVVLFMPLGAAIQWGPGRDRRRQAALFACLASLAVEGFQLHTHTRIPAVPDVVVNTLGGWLGAAVVLRLARGLTSPAGAVVDGHASRA